MIARTPIRTGSPFRLGPPALLGLTLPVAARHRRMVGKMGLAEFAASQHHRLFA